MVKGTHMHGANESSTPSTEVQNSKKEIQYINALVKQKNMHNLIMLQLRQKQ
jgi:hypothetical protein